MCFGTMRACMYVCMYVCMYDIYVPYACMHACIYICMNASMDRRVYPPSPFLAQREGCLWSHAVGRETKAATKCFDKLKWEPKKAPPKSKRDHGQLLVSRVKAWTDKWMRTVDARTQNQHSFAREEVHVGCLIN